MNKIKWPLKTGGVMGSNVIGLIDRATILVSLGVKSTSSKKERVVAEAIFNADGVLTAVSPFNGAVGDFTFKVKITYDTYSLKMTKC